MIIILWKERGGLLKKEIYLTTMVLISIILILSYSVYKKEQRSYINSIVTATESKFGHMIYSNQKLDKNEVINIAKKCSDSSSDIEVHGIKNLVITINPSIDDDYKFATYKMDVSYQQNMFGMNYNMNLKKEGVTRLHP